MKNIFRSAIAENIFNEKYRHSNGCETWEGLSKVLVNEVCGKYMPREEVEELVLYMQKMYFIPAGRYLYYAGRGIRFYNNCYLLKSEEDSREDWANLSWKSESCLLSGGGIGNDYSVYRPQGALLQRTGGFSSGPIPKMAMINEIGRRVMQGGSRRAAIYASLCWSHGDASKFLHVKDWASMPVKGAFDSTGKQLTIADLKQEDFNYPAPLDFTNISLNYDTEWLTNYWETGDTGAIFKQNCLMACKNGEPGWSFNFFDKERETLRNACTEVTSEDDSDVCNLASLNFSRIDDLPTLMRVTYLASKFLLCGTLEADLPYDKIRQTREKNRRLGLGVMGVHEWIIKNSYKYGMNPELSKWMSVYEIMSEKGANELADKLGINRPVAYRAIAPTGTIGMIAGTTTGIEPIYAVAYKRRYLKGNEYHHAFAVESAAQEMIDLYGVSPESIETSIDLAMDPERRIAFQADMQDYVDMSISSTLNLPAWGSEYNNEDTVGPFGDMLASYAHRLRGFTVYPDGGRGGQPLTKVDYEEAVSKLGKEFRESMTTTDVCELTGGGTCGI